MAERPNTRSFVRFRLGFGHEIGFVAKTRRPSPHSGLPAMLGP
jgi:hypothetical protein